MNYEPKNFDHLIGTAGFSDTLLKNHFTLYQGYVTNTNKIADLLKVTQMGGAEYAELKRRFGWEYNGMRLHELYFGNMANGGKPISAEGSLRSAVVRDFDSYELWEADFKATGAMRGIGWAILARDQETGRLHNVWVNEHDGGHLVGAMPLLVMDVFEHAFMLDYGLKRADYIGAFWNAIDWQVAEQRFASLNSYNK
ncbi:MAG: superoxide dismutase [Minisyncoccota bacterium]